MKHGEDLHISIRSIRKRLAESILLILGIALGVGVTGAGVAMVARSSRDARELLSSTQYREIVVTAREESEQMELPAMRQDTTAEPVIITTAELRAREDVPDVQYAYVANPFRFRLNFDAFGGMAEMAQRMQTQPQSAQGRGGAGGQAGEAGEVGEASPTPLEGDVVIVEEGQSQRQGTGQAGQARPQGSDEQRAREFLQRQMAEIPVPEGPQPILEEIFGYEVSPEFFDAWHLAAVEGSLFTASDMEEGAPVVVLGSQLAKTLYEDGQSMGRELLVRRELFKITGILEPTGATHDNMAFVPAFMPDLQATAGMARMFRSWNTTLHFTVAQPNRLEEARAQLASWFDQTYGTGLVNIQIPREEAEATRDRNGRLVTIILFLALSGLLIAAVNVSNILFSRALRKRKSVGILKALGASRGAVFWVFFLEALMIGIGGAIVGTGISFLQSDLIETTMGFGALSIWMLFIGVLAAWAVTTALTLLPARQASRVPAAEAIRYE